MTLTCEQARERDLARRYVARDLPAEEEADFERHFLQCPDCQRDIELDVTIRRSLRAEPASTPAGAPRGVPYGSPAGSLSAVLRRRWVVIGSGALAAAAVVLLVLRFQAAADRYAPLGAVAEPPIYLGVQVRGGADRGAARFQAAMDAYAERRYAVAAAGLEAALAAGVDVAPAEFFRAASLLMLNRPGEAVEAYNKVVALGETPYLTESHYYLAKALLRLGRADEAREELRRAAARGGDVGAQATALADSVEAWSRR